MATASPQSKQYWFAAKRYGWGWGLPVVWQGWLVLVGFLAYSSVLSAALVGICWLKGEPPAWHWGDER